MACLILEVDMSGDCDSNRGLGASDYSDSFSLFSGDLRHLPQILSLHPL